MFRLSFLFLTLLCVVACTPRGKLEYGAPSDDASVREIWVANFRPTEPAKPGERTQPRPAALAFELNTVSVPKTHVTGQIEWPSGAPDAKTDFVTLWTRPYEGLGQFSTDIDRSDRERSNETVLFVHGYNMTHGEAVYQLVQVSHDFGITSPSVLFSWPSAGSPAGYAYDRDSVLIARDQLEKVILGLTKRGRKVILIGHSMGNLLIMETLRQIEISRSLDIGTKIEALFMISPDIDGELFQTQARRLRKMPQPSVILAADQDKALQLSALITGRHSRLGSQTDRSVVGDLPVSVVNVSELGTGGTDHSIALTSPTAIEILTNVYGNTPAGDVDFAPLVDLADLE